MKIDIPQVPREFVVGNPPAQEVSRDCAHIALDPGDQVTFVTEGGGEYDVVRRPWGFYATPSVNSRLPRFGFRTAVTKGEDGKRFVMLVARSAMQQFSDYLAAQHMHVESWLDE